MNPETEKQTKKSPFKKFLRLFAYIGFCLFVVCLFSFAELIRVGTKSNHSSQCQNWKRGESVQLKNNEPRMTVKNVTPDSKGCSLEVFWVSKNGQYNHLTERSDLFKKFEEPQKLRGD